MVLPKLSEDIQEDIYLWAHVRRYPSELHADIGRFFHAPGGEIMPYHGGWIVRRPDGTYVMQEELRKGGTG